MPSSVFEEIELLLPSIHDGGGGGTFADVDARCILGSFNICGTDKYKNEFEMYHDMYSIVC